MQVRYFFNSDTEIVNGIKRSDDYALSIIYKKYYYMIHHFVTMNSGREEDAEDVFQTGVIVLYENIKTGKYKGDSSIKTYLYSICRNQWLKSLRTRREFLPITETEKFREFGLIENTDEEENSLLLETLKKQLVRLDERCRKILISFYFERLSMEDIAKIMGYTNADNAKTQKYRCIQRLKEMVGSEIRLSKTE